MKIAVIGGGIAGLGAAYLLSKTHDITLYEKNPGLGGHSRTIDIPTARGPMPVDTGFIVFNNWNYPNLLGLFKALGVPYQNSDMSFGVSIRGGWLEYASGGLFSQKANVLRPAYYTMLADILRFNKNAPAFLEKSPDITLGECLDELRMGAWFRQYYLLAMGAAIWSCPVDTILKFPARTFLQFFKNHGLLSVRNRPQWYTVTGGSREYVARLKAAVKAEFLPGRPVQKIRREGAEWQVLDAQGEARKYDQIVLACHADEALSMIETPGYLRSDILGAFTYQKNDIVVHRDESFMPRRRKAWASWVYLSDAARDEKPCVSLSYWMNNLQSLPAENPVFVTLNPGRQPREDMVYDRHSFTHPIFDTAAIKAQGRISEIQGLDGLWFCGAYQRYGFHEDGLLSAVNVARAMEISIPWDT